MTDGSRSKWRLLAVYWLAQSAVIYVGWSVLFCNDADDFAKLPHVWVDEEYAPWAFLAVVLITAGQVAFVLPVRPPRDGAPGRLAMLARHAVAGLAAGAIAGLCTAGLMVSPELFRVIQWSSPLNGWAVIWGAFGTVAVVTTGVLMVRCRDRTPIGISIGVAAMASAALLIGLASGVIEACELIRGDELDDGFYALAILGGLGVGWMVGTPLIAAFVRAGPRETRLQRLAARLFLGTVIEAVAIIPLDVMVRRRTDCYCGEGTFWSLTFCGSVGVLMLGPGIFLLLGRRRKRWLAGRCEICDYDMSGCMDAGRCPECGAGWKKDAVR